MPLSLHWFLPSHGDGRDIGPTREKVTARREPDIDYLAQVAKAADTLGFDGVLTPTGLFCEDPWVVATALIHQTSTLEFMIALRPGLMSPLLLAQMCATFQRISGDRLLLNVVAGSDADEQHRYGDWLDHDQRYERIAEFLSILHGVSHGRPYDADGAHYRMKNAMLPRPRRPLAPVYLGGSSEAARTVAAAQADVYLAWGEPPAQIAELCADVRRRAAEAGRTISCGTRFHVIARSTAEEAWQVADRLLVGMDPELIERTQRRFGRSESEGQHRMQALVRDRSELEIYPNIWAGYGLVRPGAGLALVGSHEQIADRIDEYCACGIEHLILSGQPHLEEAYWFGEGVIPLLRARGLLRGAP
ncbi:LLM class flavin-dependent oxidoreductase [Nocardia sp. NPDC051321]|uniref:LLM class flavin-dependent oxidoreductase n=1 Tax=Nocardia sp. NPDC051321 TaxID=3364323 RepID=UPI0037A94E5A